MITTIAIAALLAYLAILALLFLGQTRFIYPIPPVRSDVPPGYEKIVYLTPDGLELEAGYRPARRGGSWGPGLAGGAMRARRCALRSNGSMPNTGRAKSCA